MKNKTSSLSKKTRTTNRKPGRGEMENSILAEADGSGRNGQDGVTALGARFVNSCEELSSSRQRLLRQIIDESNETFFLSSREMGRRYNVDTATIIRTVQALGYEKFADFAQDLRAHFVTQITPYSAMKAAEQSNRSVPDLVRQSVDQDLDNLNAFRAALDPGRITEVAKQVNQ